MSKQESRYYFGCVFLYGVLSILEYTFDSIDSANVVQKCRMALLRSDDLASWLLDELFSLNDSEAAVDTESADPILENWVERVQRAAIELDEMDSQACAEVRSIQLYYLGVNWGLQVLLEFDRLVNSFNSKELQRRYKANLRLFEELTTWLKSEAGTLPSEMQSMAESEKVNRLRTRIDTVANQLATEWRDKIERLSEARLRQKTTFDDITMMTHLDGVGHHFAQAVS